MSNEHTNEPMLDMFLFETTQLIEQLERSILASEKTSCFTSDAINEIFRIMHTIKGSSAMMMFDGISTVAHSIEDIFYYLREEKPNHVDCSALSDLVLEGADFIKDEVDKIKNGSNADGNAGKLLDSIKGFLSDLKGGDNAFKAVVYFEKGCEMENIRAYSIIHKLKDITDEFSHIPENIIDDDSSADVIRRDGFKIYFKTDCSYDKIQEFFMQTVFLKDLVVEQLDDEDLKQFYGTQQVVKEEAPQCAQNESKSRDEKIGSHEFGSGQQSIISVSVDKLDKLIYFDAKTKIELTRKFYDMLEIGGYLFIGHSESINREQTRFKYIRPAVYRKE